MVLFSDAGGSRNSGPGKENGLQQGMEKGINPLPSSYEIKDKEGSSVTRWLRFFILCSVLVSSLGLFHYLVL